MAKDKLPVTQAVRALRAAGIEFTDHPYTYEDHGGTGVCARELKVDEHSVIKTLIMEDDKKEPLIVLMHGDREVSTKELARTINARTISPCSADNAFKYTGYTVGGISPFGTRKQMPVYMEETILALPRIYINGGRRGYLVGMDPKDVVKILKPTMVQVGICHDLCKDFNRDDFLIFRIYDFTPNFNSGWSLSFHALKLSQSDFSVLIRFNSFRIASAITLLCSSLENDRFNSIRISSGRRKLTFSIVVDIIHLIRIYEIRSTNR